MEAMPTVERERTRRDPDLWHCFPDDGPVALCGFRLQGRGSPAEWSPPAGEALCVVCLELHWPYPFREPR